VDKETELQAVFRVCFTLTPKSKKYEYKEHHIPQTEPFELISGKVWESVLKYGDFGSDVGRTGRSKQDAPQSELRYQFEASDKEPAHRTMTSSIQAMALQIQIMTLRRYRRRNLLCQRHVRATGLSV
jgi:hypothetical protein